MQGERVARLDRRLHDERWVAGSFAQHVDLGQGPLSSAGGRGMFWAQYGADGALRSGFVGASAQDLYPAGVAVDADGQVLTTAVIEGSVDLGAGVSTVAAGRYAVIKHAPDGRLRWLRRFGPTAQGQPTDIAVTATGVLSTGSINQAATLDAVTISPYGYLLLQGP